MISYGSKLAHKSWRPPSRSLVWPWRPQGPVLPNVRSWRGASSNEKDYSRPNSGLANLLVSPISWATTPDGHLTFRPAGSVIPKTSGTSGDVSHQLSYLNIQWGFFQQTSYSICILIFYFKYRTVTVIGTQKHFRGYKHLEKEANFYPRFCNKIN